ncbi:peptidase inhibitor family I36 protein [Kitasatospora sp. NPDC049258]|uniref:peptidase inhibitor family I36 protein n=1 Tax=Kitasatospora sp. NPDC049258 TaxID=3155394 RepID=UPI003443ECF9
MIKNMGESMLFARKTLVTASIALSAVVGALATASPASAAISTGSDSVGDCDAQCLVLYYNTGYAGSHTTIHSTTPNGGEGVYDLSAYTFQSGGAGQGKNLKNNAASAKARIWGIDSSVTVYFNSGYAGPCDKFQKTEYPSAWQLSNTYNENASVYFRNIPVNQGCVNFG